MPTLDELEKEGAFRNPETVLLTDEQAIETLAEGTRFSLAVCTVGASFDHACSNKAYAVVVFETVVALRCRKHCRDNEHRQPDEKYHRYVTGKAAKVMIAKAALLRGSLR